MTFPPPHFRFNVELQRIVVALRTFRVVRNEKRQTQTNQRFAVRRNVDLQRCRYVFDNHTGDHGDGIAAGR